VKRNDHEYGERSQPLNVESSLAPGGSFRGLASDDLEKCSQF
jgi:hypothetical protein